MDEHIDSYAVVEGITTWLQNWNKQISSVAPQLLATRANQVLLDSLIDELHACEQHGVFPWEVIADSATPEIGFCGPPFDEIT